MCAKEQIFDATEGACEALKAAFVEGWDTAYSPRGGVSYRLVAPRTCPECGLPNTAWFALQQRTPEELSGRHQHTLARILAEPFSLVDLKAFEGKEAFKPVAIETGVLYLAEYRDSNSLHNLAAHNEFRSEYGDGETPGVLYLAERKGDTVFRWHPLGSDREEPNWLMGVTSTEIRAASIIGDVAKIMTQNTRYSFAVSKAIRLRF